MTSKKRGVLLSLIFIYLQQSFSTTAPSGPGQALLGLSCLMEEVRSASGLCPLDARSPSQARRPNTLPDIANIKLPRRGRMASYSTEHAQRKQAGRPKSLRSGGPRARLLPLPLRSLPGVGSRMSTEFMVCLARLHPNHFPRSCPEVPGQEGKACCGLDPVGGPPPGLPLYLLLQGAFQGLHPHLLFPESSVEGCTLGLCFCSNLSNLLIGSVFCVLFVKGQKTQSQSLDTGRGVRTVTTDICEQT